MSEVNMGSLPFEPGYIYQVANPASDNYGRLGLIVQVFGDEAYLWFEYPSDGQFYDKSQLCYFGKSDVTVKEAFGTITVSRTKQNIHWPMPMLGDDETKARTGQKPVKGIHADI